MAKAIQITQYEANDGSLFLSAAEADAHDFKLENGEKIRKAGEAFVNTIGAADRSRNMKLNTVEEFLAFYLPWVEAGEPEVERTVFDTPKEEAKTADADEKADEAVKATEQDADEAQAGAGAEMF
jgi:hypothetical protein